MPYRSVFKPGLFEGQTVVVTGGGSGIGRCTAHEIAALGAHVVITGRKADKLAVVKGEIEAAGGSCETHAFDIREEAEVKEAIGKIVAANGRIHGLFNNAGGLDLAFHLGELVGLAAGDHDMGAQRRDLVRRAAADAAAAAGHDHGLAFKQSRFEDRAIRHVSSHVNGRLSGSI